MHQNLNRLYNSFVDAYDDRYGLARPSTRRLKSNIWGENVVAGDKSGDIYRFTEFNKILNIFEERLLLNNFELSYTCKFQSHKSNMKPTSTQTSPNN